MIKYKFNPDTLKFEQQEFALARFIYQKVLPKFAFTLVLGISLGVLASYYIASPAEQGVLRERESLVEKFKDLNKKFHQSLVELSEIQKHDDEYRMIFQKEPLSEAERLAGFGGVDKYEALRGFSEASLMIAAAYNSDKMISFMKVQSGSYAEVADLVKNKEKMLASIPSIQPVDVKDFIRFGSPFGYRFHPILHIYRMHAGVDLTAPHGAPIYAAGNGTVAMAGTQNGYGNVVKINHGFGYTTVYAHMSKILVKEGQKVNRGEVIGLVGNTGLSTSPHCHYEVRINDKPVDPVNFYKSGLSEEEYQNLLKASANFSEVSDEE
ncbi:MAG: M23 family metallopeptidase [Bacteroidales bacterium]|jgi:murein DD-endopeptidase MepM/ murein hydrolase activator NlpD|nr:M23 family metallopeptidase [Bacteroidales bacterium]